MPRGERGFRQSRIERAIPKRMPSVKEVPKTKVQEKEETYRRWITRRNDGS